MPPAEKPEDNVNYIFIPLKKNWFFRAFVGETTESAMSSVGKREYELLHDILDLCTVYYAKEERWIFGTDINAGTKMFLHK